MSETASTENSGKSVGLKNLKPFPKGKSPNPGGRPKKDHAAKFAEQVLEYVAKAGDPKKAAKQILAQIAKGNAKPFAILADRAYGKVAQSANVEGEVKYLIVSDL